MKPDARLNRRLSVICCFASAAIPETTLEASPLIMRYADLEVRRATGELHEDFGSDDSSGSAASDATGESATNCDIAHPDLDEVFFDSSINDFKDLSGV